MKIIWKILKWLFLSLLGLWILFFIQFFVFKKDALVMEGEYKQYIGTWELENADEHSILVIEKSGYMKMAHNYGNSSTSISWPISSIKDWEMEVSFWLFHLDYVITTPVRKWSDLIMNVDWKDFIKKLWPSDLTIPEKEELMQLLSGTFADLSKGVETSDFSDMYEHSANILKAQADLAKFLEIFGIPFSSLDEKLKAELNVSLSDFINKKIILSKNPYISNNWELFIIWNFVSSPTMYFRAIYSYDYPEWKFVGLGVRFSGSY